MLTNKKIKKLIEQTHLYAMCLIDTGEETDVVDWFADICEMAESLRWRDPKIELPEKGVIVVAQWKTKTGFTKPALAYVDAHGHWQCLGTLVEVAAWMYLPEYQEESNDRR